MRLSSGCFRGTEIGSTAGSVGAGNVYSATAGAAVLESGGNAVDAAVAAAFVAFVAEPQMCGVGGYGHMAIYLNEGHQFYSVDHGIRAPRAVSPTSYSIDTASEPNYLGAPAVKDRANEIGHLACGVPGAVAGLAAAHRRWGSLPWPQLLEPAIDLAMGGLPVSYDLMASIASHARDIAGFTELAGMLLPGGHPPTAADGLHLAADVLDLSDLAATLRLIAKHGEAGFYTGPIADAIDAEFQRGGGHLRAGDLATYQPRVNRETPQRFHGVDYITGADTVGYETLNILMNFDLTRWGPSAPQYYHLVAEALACAFTDNLTYYGDPEVVASPVTGLTSPAFGQARATMLREDRALPRPVTALDPWPYNGEAQHGTSGERSVGGAGGTTKVVTGDRWGNLAALCTTLETGFGSLILVPGTGIIMNNAMLDFDPRPGRANSIAPGKMPLFGAPTIVAARDGEGLFAASGSGGYRIEAAVLHSMINSLVFGMGPQAAADAPRVHSQGTDTVVEDSIGESVVRWLTDAGHKVVSLPQQPGAVSLGRVSAVRRDPGTGEVRVGASPAWCTATATAQAD